MQARPHEITAIKTPRMKLPQPSAAQWPSLHWPRFSLPAFNWVALSPAWLDFSWLRQPLEKLRALKSARLEIPVRGLAVLDKFAHYRMPALATKTMLPLMLAIGVLLLAMVRVEFIPAGEVRIEDVGGAKFAPVAASELTACQTQSWPNFSPECIKSPTQVAAARRVDVR